MSNTLPDQLPQEWQKAINQQAKAYSITMDNTGGEKAGYVQGATTYALRAYKAEQEVVRLRKALQEIVDRENARWTNQPDVKSHIWSIANEALTPQTNSNG